EAGTDAVLSRGRPVESSSTETTGLEAAKAVDGDPRTRWGSEEGVDPQWISVDLGANRQVSRVRLRWEVAYGRSYRVETSADGAAWTAVYRTTSGNGGLDDLTGLLATGRFVRVF